MAVNYVMNPAGDLVTQEELAAMLASAPTPATTAASAKSTGNTPSQIYSDGSTKWAVVNKLDMSRNQELANKTIYNNGYYTVYDDLGYAVKAVNASKSRTDDEALYIATQGAAGTKPDDYDAIYGSGNYVNGTAVDVTGLTKYDDYGGIYADLAASTASTGTASTGTSTDTTQSFEEWLKANGYDQYSEQTKAAIAAAVEAAVLGYQGQIDDTNTEYDELARQAYITKMLGEKNLGQKLSAGGYSGGMADSQRIALEADYQNQRNEVELQRQQVLTELNNAIEQARLSGDLQTAQELADYTLQLQSQWASYVQNQQTLENQNYWNQVYLDNENYWNQQAAETAAAEAKAKAEAEAAETAYNKAVSMIANGYLPDDDLLEQAGITKTEALVRVQQVQDLLKQEVLNATTDTEKTYSADQVNAALNLALKGDSSNAVRSIIEAYYGLPLESVVKAYSEEEEEQISNEAGARAAIYSNVAEGIADLYKRGYNTQTITAAIASALSAGDITQSEASELLSIYGGGAAL